MKQGWKTVNLGDVLKLNIDSVDVLSQSEFRFAGVYCFGGGLFERGLISGDDTTYKTFNRLHKNQIVISKVKGWEGAIGLVTDEFEGMFLSPVYPTFNLVINDKADISYIHYFLQQKDIWLKLFSNSKGIGARRNSISEKTFLNLSIPLPPLAEQQQIVARIESIQSRIEQIRKLRIEQEKEIENLRNSLFENLKNNQNAVTIGSVLIPHQEIVLLDNEKDYRQITVKMEHKGVLLRGTIKGAEVGSKQFLAKEGDFIISKIDARNGAMGLVPTELNGAIVTGDFPLYSFSDKINPFFFNYFSNTFYFDNACKQASEGKTNIKRLKIEKFEDIRIPLPPIDEQNRIVAFLEKVNQIRQAHKAQEAEFSALMPSLLNKAFKGELVEKKQEIPLVTAQNYELETQHFVKRKMLGVYIINQSLNDKKFGDTKFEKLMYLAEYWAIKRNFNQQYYKQAAGPYDNRYTYAFYEQITESGWFIRQQKATDKKQSIFVAGKNHEKSKTDYGYFSEDELAKINQLINLFNSSDYKAPEIISTLYAVWNNRIILQQEISDELLIRDFYDWDKHKAVYTEDKVKRGLNWMRKIGIVPDGWGEVIEKVRKKNKYHNTQ